MTYSDELRQTIRELQSVIDGEDTEPRIRVSAIAEKRKAIGQLAAMEKAAQNDGKANVGKLAGMFDVEAEDIA